MADSVIHSSEPEYHRCSRGDSSIDNSGSTSGDLAAVGTTAAGVEMSVNGAAYNSVCDM